MNEVLEIVGKMDYKNVLKYFTEISAVPRGSGHNEKISAFLVEFAKKHNLKYVQDEALNVIIYKPATKGYESHTPIILQGHMDMVCVKENGCDHDFEKEGLVLKVDGDWLHADRTTLGADDGIAVAYSMALLADDTISHPALEVVITTDEETGMDGAKALDVSLLKGRYMLNLDSEDEGVALVSCAGGMRFEGRIDLQQMKASGILMNLCISGLIGGHSGQEIINNRTNANVLMGRMLFDLSDRYTFLIVSMEGGKKDNAIPDAACAKLLVKPEEKEGFLKEANRLISRYKTELSTSEPGLTIDVTDNGEEECMAIHPTSATKVLFAILEAPNAVQTMSADIKGLVESSLNLGIFKAEGTCAHFHYALRSSKATYRSFMCSKLKLLFGFLGADYEYGSEYPAWEFKKDSVFREVFSKTFEAMYKKKPEFTAIHAGLECGLISEQIPDIDIVSIGPDMKDIHTPKERLNIPSFIRVYQFIEKLLENCK